MTEFSITILGSGAATPTLGRHCSAQVVNIGCFKMLVDCGEGTQNQIRAFHQKMQAFSTIFISHLHGDHWFGLPGLLSSMHLCGRTEPVTVFAPKGIKELLERIFEVSGSHLGYELTVNEIAPDGPEVIFENGKCKVTAFPLLHSVPTYGFLFEEQPPLLNLRKDVRARYGLSDTDCRRVKLGYDVEGADGTVILNELLTKPRKLPRSYAYCCDTAYSEQLLDTITGATMLCIESTFDKSLESLASLRQHCTAAQAAQLARQAGVKQLLLTHFSARYKDLDLLLDEARTIFPDTFPANDGETYTLPPNDQEAR